MRIPYEVPTAVGRDFDALAPDVAAAILLTLEAGWTYATSSPDVHAGAGEVTITERLRDGMREALKNSNRKMLVVLAGAESRSRPDVVLPDGRTDIPILVFEIFLRFQNHDPHAIIECKRIAGGDAHLCREYVVEGIDRFKSGKYARSHTAGFMAGYLLTGDAAAAAASVNAYLSRKARREEHLALSGVLARPWLWG